MHVRFKAAARMPAAVRMAVFEDEAELACYTRLRSTAAQRRKDAGEALSEALTDPAPLPDGAEEDEP
jgi:hypothetical protein